MLLNLMFTTLLILIICFNYAANEPDRRVITTLKYSKHYVRPTVVNGIPAKWGQVPYLVSLKEQLVKTSKLKYIWTNICGGSIIGPKKVLTAAHCFEHKNFYYKKHPDKLRVVAGEFTTELIHTGNTDTTEKCQWRKVEKVVLHNKFSFPENDIALVFVDEPWQYNGNVGYIVPARRKIDYLSQCIAAGFGSIMHKKQVISPVLLIGQMFLMPRSNCTVMWEMNMDNYICSYSFLSDVSKGDSGGPLTCKGTLDPAEMRSERKELLVGVISGKNFDKTSLFTRVSEYSKWIDQNLACRTKLSLVPLLLSCFTLLSINALLPLYVCYLNIK